VLYRNKHKTWYPPAMWIDWMELEKAPSQSGPEAKAPELFLEKSAAVSEQEHAKQIIERFATRAFRHSVPETAFVESLSQRFARLRAAGDSFEAALKESLSAVLASPGFLYLSEPGATNRARQISDPEVATRLSYFLWSAPPDAELREAGRTGTIRSPEVLEQHVNRMIASRKSQAFVNGFVHQWLGLDRLDFFRFNARLFPEFDDSMKIAARNEVLETFAHLLRSGGSLARLLKSDRVVINGLLAQFYGIDGVVGDEFRPVALQADSPRGGLLGMSAIMAMGGNGERTSPVERGAWVLRKLLHDPPPPAPPNVPQLSRLGDQPLSPRERILAHQEEAQCLQCHRKIDPIGFGLENFNAIGQWRTTEAYKKAQGGLQEWPIDPGGALHKGQTFNDYFGLREILASKQGAFARGFAEALFEYALGRPPSFNDEDAVAGMVREAEKSDYSVAEFVRALARSPVFKRK
jgi:hypothetical protein